VADIQLVQNVAPHSIEISRNAKGEASFCIKIYAADEKDAAERALAVARQVRRALQEEPL